MASEMNNDNNGIDKGMSDEVDENIIQQESEHVQEILKDNKQQLLELENVKTELGNTQESENGQEILKDNKQLLLQLENVKTELGNTLKDLHSVKKELELCKLQKTNAENYVQSLRQDNNRLKEQLLQRKTIDSNDDNIKDDQHINAESPQRNDEQQLQHLECKDRPKVDDSDKKANDNIAATLQSAAEEYLNNKGLVYDEKSGWYYDWSTGYYYDPNTHLYYQKETKAYYYYDQKKEVYIFYCYSDDTDVATSKDIANSYNLAEENEIEEGEYKSNDEEDIQHLSDGHSCIRCIVMQSNRLKYGSLYIITIEGIIIGRENATEKTIQIPELAISKKHAQIGYDLQESKYHICDLGSKNGTYLNDVKIANDGSTFYLQHGDYIKIGSTSFLLHIHPGYDTCDDCEPGQILSRIPVADHITSKTETAPICTDSDKLEDQRRHSLKQLKRKYGLGRDDTSESAVSTHEKYKDRAEERRVHIGSDFPHALQTSSSVKKPIEKSNKGHKLLEKMGWSAGQGLGRNNTGISQPVEVQMRLTNAGLGTSGVSSSMDDIPDTNKQIRDHKILKITAQRYAKAEPIDMFAE